MSAARLVIRADNDSPCPTVGCIIGWEDDDRVLVLWGDDAYGYDTDRARVENMDELTPYLTRR